MDLFFEDSHKNKTCTDRDFTQPGSTDTTVQLVISLLLGFSAFFSFCVSLSEEPLDITAGYRF